MVCSDGGLAVGEVGATHQCVEDLSLRSAFPRLVVVNPCDGPEMRKAVKALLDYEGPAYLRLGRMAVESVTDETPGYEFTLGKAALLRDGSDVTLAATGLMVQRALAAADILAAKGLSARVLDIHTIKPLDTEAILAAARDTGCIVTSEEHSIIGGLGSAVAAVCAENCPVPVVRHGVMDEFGRSGKALEVLEHYGLTAEVMAEKAERAIALKKK